MESIGHTVLLILVVVLVAMFVYTYLVHHRVISNHHQTNLIALESGSNKGLIETFESLKASVHYPGVEDVVVGKKHPTPTPSCSANMKYLKKFCSEQCGKSQTTPPECQELCQCGPTPVSPTPVPTPTTPPTPMSSKWTGMWATTYKDSSKPNTKDNIFTLSDVNNSIQKKPIQSVENINNLQLRSGYCNTSQSQKKYSAYYNLPESTGSTEKGGLPTFKGIDNLFQDPPQVPPSPINIGDQNGTFMKRWKLILNSGKKHDYLTSRPKTLDDTVMKETIFNDIFKDDYQTLINTSREKTNVSTDPNFYFNFGHLIYPLDKLEAYTNCEVPWPSINLEPCMGLCALIYIRKGDKDFYIINMAFEMVYDATGTSHEMGNSTWYKMNSQLSLNPSSANYCSYNLGYCGDENKTSNINQVGKAENPNGGTCISSDNAGAIPIDQISIYPLTFKNDPILN